MPGLPDRLDGGQVIWFCCCNRIPPGGFCPKHGYVSEEDRKRRRSEYEAHERVTFLAEKSGGRVELEKMLMDK
jgi:hypothetical protein